VVRTTDADGKVDKTCDLPTLAVWQSRGGDPIAHAIERVRRDDREYRHFAARGVPVLAPDGSIREWVGTCTDIAGRKRAEEAASRLPAIGDSLEQGAITRKCNLRLRRSNNGPQ
jgi:hypothetical protein